MTTKQSSYCCNSQAAQTPDAGSSTTTSSSSSAKRSSSGCGCLTTLFISLFVLVIAIVSNYFFFKATRQIDILKYNDVKSDTLSYKWFQMENFFSKKTLKLFQDYALSDTEPFSTIVEEKSVDTAGEAVPIGDPNCKHPFMTLNVNRTMCHFSSRLDVGMHFLRTGGFNGHTEYYDRMVTRILIFRKRLWQHQYQQSQQLNQVNLPFKKIKEFNSPEFLGRANEICSQSQPNSDDKKHQQQHHTIDINNGQKILNDMFQLDLLLILPGQEMPTHLNVPYFWGATRENFPQWLLVIMKKSKLFDHLFIPQVQGLSWLTLDDLELTNNKDDDQDADKKHTTKEDESDEYVDIYGDGGDFYLYPYLSNKSNEKNSVDGSTLGADEATTVKKEGKHEQERRSVENQYVILKPKVNSAVLFDGARVIHGLDRYKPNEMPPLFSANHHYSIKYDRERQKWLLFSYLNEHLASYAKNEIKLLVAWNMHCFADASKRDNFQAQKNFKQLSINDIIDTFKRDLRAKKKLPSEKLDPIDLWTIALKEYLNYPVNTFNQNSTNILGFNYCLLPHMLPDWLSDNLIKPLLDKLC